MEMRSLGNTDIQVSRLCLGSMTWGTQNTSADAASQIDRARDAGVNFIDTASLYPTTPLSADTFGGTEKIIGDWFAASGKRDDMVLATKVKGNGGDWVSGDIDAAKLRQGLDDSLRRLQTDRVDLYQLHWPNRGSYHFRRNWTYDPTSQDNSKVLDNTLEILNTADELIREGKMRTLGLSNESAWGTAMFLSLADRHGLPRVVTVQNEYNLMCRLFDLDMAELSHHEQVGLLAFSPLAAGSLSGKYVGGALPAGSRRTLNENLSGRYTEASRPVCERYVTLAQQHGLDPAAMALAFCLSRPFMTSVIIGATRMEQLEANLAAADLVLSDDVLHAIQGIHRESPIPM